MSPALPANLIVLSPLFKTFFFRILAAGSQGNFCITSEAPRSGANDTPANGVQATSPTYLRSSVLSVLHPFFLYPQSRRDDASSSRKPYSKPCISPWPSSHSDLHISRAFFQIFWPPAGKWREK
ncbi:hypothetical protein B0H11DRAFT_1199932 [Mycena galericulata]|nr:hypothetical protein B0H11DRAFT_1199932 [Mycena galericulata]